ncbi:Selenocysteine lyase [Acropora cervicornis]|uniref:Selenocysteine lyase n=1 Tax=Acropora cervicornis TaxID=6130 RepID=A0AAD9UYZ9_ACRCE|nr:Selenocysteine lyase [Acropora cervicornis]
MENEDQDKIYLDYNATTPLESSVLTAIHEALRDAWGNPSSSYMAGKKAAQAIKQARNSTADMIGALSNDVIFTSGGTEANNMVINCALEHFNEFYAKQEQCTPHQVPHVITSNLEHDSIQLPLLQLKQQGQIEVAFVPASKDSGAVTASAIEQEVKPNTCLVTVMMANNETGVIQPIEDISKAIREKNKIRSSEKLPRILIHTDAAQAIGKIKVNVKELGVDYLTVVGHKFYGPRIGALYARNLGHDTMIYPMFYGGGQERNFRPGTENTGMIAGLGQACQLVLHNLNQYHNNMKMVRDYLELKLEETFGDKIHFNGKFEASERIPNTCNVSFLGPGLEGRKVLGTVEKLQASVGAACHSDNVSHPSPILTAIGVPCDVAMNALRLSVGRYTSKDDVEAVMEDLKAAVEFLRKEWAIKNTTN